MPPLVIALAPFAAQAVVIGFDEFWFHHRRGLPRWERIGHPLDTATILLCFGFVLVVPYAPARLWQYVALAVLSTLFVTKDEFVHAETCGGPEQWLHALLFALHPVVLASAACLWPAFWGGDAALFPVSAADGGRVRAAFVAQTALTAAFGLYQIVYWNGPWARKTAR